MGAGIALLAALALFAGGTTKRRRPKGQARPAVTGPAPLPEPGVGDACPPGWIDMGEGDCLFADECDPARPETIPPGYECVASDEGIYGVFPLPDPAALNYGPLQGREGVWDALTLLGNTQPGYSFEYGVADFQDHIGKLYGVPIRKDGQLDNNTISWLIVALTDYRDGGWYSPEEWVAAQQAQFEEELEAEEAALREDPEAFAESVVESHEPLEQDAAYNLIDIWGPDLEGGGWSNHRNELTAWKFYDTPEDANFDREAVSGMSFSEWLSMVAYWALYVRPDSPAPRQFSLPFTQGWAEEEPFRNAWMRIREHVLDRMEAIGAEDGTFQFE